MSFWVVTSTGKVLSRTAVQRVTNLELQLDENKAKCEAFTTAITERLGGNEMIPIGEDCRIMIPDNWDDPNFNKEFVEEYGKTINDPNIREADQDFTPDSFDDTYLNMELALPRVGAEVQFGRVVKQLRDKDGFPIGTAHDNQILDTRLNEVGFQDGHKTSMAANAFAENLFAEVNDEGNRHVLFAEIVDHRTNGKQLTQQDAFVVDRSSTKRRRETTAGWELLVRWKDSSTSCVALKDLKASYPVQIAEYAVKMQLAEEPAFAWWVPYTLRKRNRIIANKLKSKYWIRTHKFGIKIPKTVAQARQFDEENGNLMGRMATPCGGTPSSKK